MPVKERRVASNKRLNPRTQTANLLSYTVTDEDNNIVEQGMGRTLNISEGGMLLETHIAIDTELKIDITIAFEEEILKLQGRIIRSATREDGKFESGIQFMEMGDKINSLLKQYVVLFKGQEGDD